jgi:SNF2 family DNA or RNA helicase
MLTAPSSPWAIIAPRNVKATWRDELEQWAPGKHDYIPYHYEELRKVDPATFSRCGYVVVDEAHYLKNVTTDRFRSLYSIRQAMHPEARLLLVTGTPVYSYPIDLAALLILARVMPMEQEPAFKFRYCDPTLKYLPGVGQRMDLRGASNLAELAELCKPYLTRRTWKEVGLSMPPLTFVEVECEVPTGSVYREAASDFNKWYLVNKGKSAPPLARFTTLRRLLAGAKVEDAVERLEADLRNESSKALVFSEFRETLERLKSKLADKVECFITLGGDSERQREQEVERFKASRGPALMLATTGALGIGVNLQDASRVYFLDFGFEPARFEQAFRRAWRLGQSKPVSVVRFYCPGDPLENFIIKNQMKKELYMEGLGLRSSSALTTLKGEK